MHLPNSNSPWITIVVILFTAHIIPFSQEDPRISDAGLFCGQGRSPPNISYIPLFVDALEVLSQHVTEKGWGQYALHSTNISVYTLAQCYHDLSYNDCLQCYAESRTRLPRCLPAVSGRIFLDGCFLRYDRYDFFNESVDSVWDTVNCNSSVGTAAGVGADPDFGVNVRGMVEDVTARAAANGRFAALGSKGVFGLAECWNTTSADGCRVCLAKARSEISGCLPSREGRALNAGCYLRYSTMKFFSNHSEESDSKNSGTKRTGTSVAICLSVLAFSLLSLFTIYAAYRRWKRQKKERDNLGQIHYSYNRSNLNFKYETLEKATNYFDVSRKIGQGGSGSVYRGSLPNGKTVAVKRLFFSTRQWVDEFFNEVNLISGVEHENLVKLLGCSIEGPESLLVYEFVPNGSLEQYLFGNDKIKILNWKKRYGIVVGTARGLSYLHGGSDYSIIHRDIKCSNILLDENLHPKIADFGLARYFGADQTHLSTGIAGTLGYMAPEYLVKGQLTEKADVYSYGVLLLEIVCGRKNNAFGDDSGSLVQTVWMLYKTDRLSESFDPCLRGYEFPLMVEEVSKVLRIGLLCAQASATLRPSMEEVVRMLTEENCEIPEPNQPPFLSASAIAIAERIRRSSCSTSTSTTNVERRQHPSSNSNPSSGTFSTQSSYELPRS